MRKPQIAAMFLLTCSATIPVLAEEHRHHKAHEHGTGHLNVAVDQNTLMIDLSMPAMDVVGFEHPINNEEERGQVERATALLQDGMQLFALTPAAKCVLVRADVESALLENEAQHEHDGKHEDEHEHDGKHAYEEHEHDEKHADDEHDHDEEEHAHADFDVSYQFNCQLPAQLNGLTLSLFDYFPATRRLITQMITPTGQSGAELTPDNSMLNLK